jgi:hypothetical protein
MGVARRETRCFAAAQHDNPAAKYDNPAVRHDRAVTHTDAWTNVLMCSTGPQWVFLYP